MLALATLASAAALLPATVHHRRSVLRGAAAAVIVGPAVANAEDTTSVTKMDAFQLKASYNGLDDALRGWGVEIAQIQLGNEPSSVVAVAGLNDVTLQHFAESGSAAAVQSYKKRRDALLQQLFLARGAARYEKDPQVAREYINRARAECEGARDELGTIASALGIELAQRKPAGDKPEDKIVFTPRETPKVENRLTL
jgi:hypothetical protein